MYEKFEGLPLKKREMILNAAIHEFSEKGYDYASTNEIVKEAGISKGLLFHYFGNKKQLFLYVFHFVMDHTVTDFYEKLDLSNRDLFARLEQAIKIKMEILKRYPSFFHFFEAIYFDFTNGRFEELKNSYEKGRLVVTQPVFSDLDASLFRNQVDVDKQIATIYWALEGLSRKYVREVKETSLSLDEFYRQAFVEVEHYLQLLRKVYYH